MTKAAQKRLESLQHYILVQALNHCNILAFSPDERDIDQFEKIRFATCRALYLYKNGAITETECSGLMLNTL